MSERSIPLYARVDGYAKVGGPPDDWSKYGVVDLDTWKEIKGVIEVDCNAGWLRKFREGKDGRFIVSEKGDPVIERLEGNFRLRKMKVTKVESR